MGHLTRQHGTRPAVFGAPTRAGSWARLVAELRAGLGPFAADDPFDEPLRGLQMRELRRPELFQRFFGRALAA